MRVKDCARVAIILQYDNRQIARRLNMLSIVNRTSSYIVIQFNEPLKSAPTWDAE